MKYRLRVRMPGLLPMGKGYLSEVPDVSYPSEEVISYYKLKQTIDSYSQRYKVPREAVMIVPLVEK